MHRGLLLVLSTTPIPKILIPHYFSPCHTLTIAPTPFKCTPLKLSPYATPVHMLLDPLLNQHPPPHLLSYAPIFQFCTGHSFFKLGQQAHAHMIIRGLEPNGFVGAKMVAMYASSGDLSSALIIFSRINKPSCLLYNAIIRAYAKFGNPQETLSLYCQMHCLGLIGDNFTFPFVLKCCADISSVKIGKCIHGQSLRIGLEIDMFVGTSLIDMYVKCGELIDARNLFDKMNIRDVSSWNALIAGYMKDGQIWVAEDLFWQMPLRNIVSWTSMISGYVQNGFAEPALDLFDEMLQEDSEVKPNWITIMSVLPACGHAAALDRGRRIHEYATRVGLDLNSSVQSALIAMYAKCGSLVDARQCFDRVLRSDKNLVSWNAMITAYASHGHGTESLAIFEDMIRAGIKPDAITFTGLLSGCSHSGLIDIGLRYFHCMRLSFAVEPSVEHYACIIDLLSRAGRLEEAKEIITQMPMEAGASIWGALLAASQKHKNLDIAEMAAMKLFVLEPENSGNYVLLSNIYADIGMWEKVDNLRTQIKLQGVKRNPGCSWIEINGKSHLFLGGDTSHPQSKEIYTLLALLPEKDQGSWLHT